VATTRVTPERDNDEVASFAAGFSPAQDASHEVLESAWVVPRQAFLATTASDATGTLEVKLEANSRLATAPTDETLLAIADAIGDEIES
jgi:hypothetical protein